ncbi:hypothetical protein [Streptomyces specialis]|uniref:hypothetical protein n=1 Tax=Streptomyces specialis TaxID=498367 RepID=UPI00073EEE16|nr:hypothetical protein [Streptomyces specialis]
MGERTPNVRLERLFKQSRLRGDQFARAVNRLAGQSGVRLHYRQPSVSNWLAGTMPREEARPFIVEVLSRRLGRPVTHVDAGFPPPAEDPNSRAGMGTVEELIDLCRSDMDPSRRGILHISLYSAALSIPGWHDVVGRLEAVQGQQVRRIGMADVEAVTSMTDLLSQRDTQFGGRETRPMAAVFLANTVAAHLRADASEDVRTAMLSAASNLCFVTGWMAMDEGAHGLAQRYYVKGLELAGAAEDHLLYCTILRGMSVQALGVGDAPTALRLATAAAVTPDADHRTRAFFAGHQAHAYAASGERQNALRAIRVTETSMDKAETKTRGYGPDTVAYHVAEVRYGLGDVAGSLESLGLHSKLVDTRRRRTRVRCGALLAERQLELGHLEAACATWHGVLDDYPYLQSGYADERVATMKARLRPYLSNATARTLHERSRTLNTPRPTPA